MLRLPSTLPADLETLAHRTIGCCLNVHRALGPGLREVSYVRAVAIELEVEGIPFEREKTFTVRYRGQLLCQQRVDLLVADSLVLEVKVVEILAPVHAAQVLSYLRIAELRLGLLVNFNVAVLRQGVKRIAL
ncbi:MAG: GxxExxY protein [Vicinamibacterales bacterium]